MLLCVFTLGFNTCFLPLRPFLLRFLFLLLLQSISPLILERILIEGLELLLGLAILLGDVLDVVDTVFGEGVWAGLSGVLSRLCLCD